MLTEKFEHALIYTLRLHRDQTRKGTKIPYFAHLMSVAALVLESGGDEEMAIAALLHDAVEDQGGTGTLVEIRELFGERVAMIVEGCTDAFESPKPPWRSRKEAYLDHLSTAPAEVRLVSLADKLHNARSILSDLLQNGIHTMNRFKGGVAGTVWYYQQLLGVFRQHNDSPMIDELDRVVSEIVSLLNLSKP